MTTVARSMALGLVALFGIGCTITSYKDPVPPPPPGDLPAAGAQPNQGATTPGRRPVPFLPGCPPTLGVSAAGSGTSAVRSTGS